ELAQLSQEEKPNQEELVEWLVRCAENPATRWEGAFELAMSAWELRAKCTQDDADADSEESDSSEETFEDGSADPAQKESTVEPVTEAQDLGARASLAALLTADQKERLMTALLDTEQITEGDEQLIELVKDFHDPRLIPFLVSRLRRTENNPPHSANTIVQVVAELLKDNRISALAESYDDAPYDYEDDENEERGDNKASTQSAAVRERSAQIRLFLQQVERKIRK
ncbi:MAG TPA: hypothetical protein VNS63_19045, partial [Blastocatellia bacterium]|nr:hypothetical protein [Blastocatellia bacterium]